MLAVLAAGAAGVAAGLTAARRASRRGSKLPLADIRARQGVATGLCAGAAAALMVCVLGIGTAAFVPDALDRLRWAMSGPHPAPTGVYAFEISLTGAAAGHLLVLVIFPVLGAGLGAWGGLCASGRPGQLPGEGGGGGGHGPPAPPSAPPSGGQRLGEEHPPAILRGGYLVDLPAVPGLAGAAEDAGHGARPPGHDPRRGRRTPLRRCHRATSAGASAPSGGREYPARIAGLGRTATWPLPPDDPAVVEDLAAPDAPGFGALHRAGQASLPQRTGPAACLGQLQFGRPFGEPELRMTGLARQRAIQDRGRPGQRRHGSAGRRAGRAGTGGEDGWHGRVSFCFDATEAAR